MAVPWALIISQVLKGTGGLYKGFANSSREQERIGNEINNAEAIKREQRAKNNPGDLSPQKPTFADINTGGNTFAWSGVIKPPPGWQDDNGILRPQGEMSPNYNYWKSAVPASLQPAPKSAQDTGGFSVLSEPVRYSPNPQNSASIGGQNGRSFLSMQADAQGANATGSTNWFDEYQKNIKRYNGGAASWQNRGY